MSDQLVSQPTAAPTQKVAAGGIAGALATILVFAAGQAGFEITPEVAVAFGTVLSFAASYFKRNKATDI